MVPPFGAELKAKLVKNMENFSKKALEFELINLGDFCYGGSPLEVVVLSLRLLALSRHPTSYTGTSIPI